jgi:tetratricopeptide (TPR) repeat protein
MPLTRLVPVVFALLLAAPCAYADGYEPPPFTADEVVLEADALPEGWTAAESTDAATALEDAATEALKGAGFDLDEDGASASVVVRDGAGAEVALLLLDLDADPAAAAAALKSKAGASGWTYRELGSPGRLVLASGPEASRATAVDVQVRQAVRSIAQMGFARYRDEAYGAARDRAEAALAIDPEAAAAHAVRGLALAQAAGADEAKEALAELRRGLKAGAQVPAEGALALHAWATLGQKLLMGPKSAEADREAKQAYEKAVSLESHDKPGSVFVAGLHYDLGCAHARLGEKEAAIREVEKGLRGLKEADPKAWPQHLEHAKSKDPDLDSIRSDPAFAEMLGRLDDSKPSSGV